MRFQKLVRLAAVAILTFITVIAGAVEAHAAPKAAIVMDMRNGKVLYARSADARLHPASLTKMMTLYLTFEAVRTGQLRLDQKVVVSRKAARQPASKLYLSAGKRVTIRSMIRATAIKSANDAAMVLAEAIAGSQDEFGRLMTRTARRLGMKNSAFRNPHGLTQSGHYSSARDMAILARHLFFDYPEYYNIFKRRTDHAAGKRIWTTNRLLSTYPGADGIKTGYTSAAGYNLAASAHRGSKRVIAVQFGASSSADRSRRVAKLLDIGFSRAKRSVKRIAPRAAQRSVAQADWSPVPLRRTNALQSPQSSLELIASAVSPVGQAQASESAESTIVSSHFAPQVSAPPVLRDNGLRSAQAGGDPLPATVNGIPLPVRRPALRAGPGSPGWRADLGPYANEAAALAALVGLSAAPSATGIAEVSVARAQSPAEAGRYYVRMQGLTQSRALDVCGDVADRAPTCRVLPDRG